MEALIIGPKKLWRMFIAILKGIHVFNFLNLHSNRNKSTTEGLIIHCFMNTDAACLNSLGCPHPCHYLNSCASLLAIFWPFLPVACPASYWISDSSLYVRISGLQISSFDSVLGIPSQSFSQCQRSIKVARFSMPKRLRNDWPLTSSITLPREPSSSIIEMWHRWVFSSAAGPGIRRPSVSHLSRIVLGVSSAKNKPVIVCPCLSSKIKNNIGRRCRRSGDLAIVPRIGNGKFNRTAEIIEREW